MYWKSFFIFISDKLINELSDFEYQKRYKVAKATESVDLANCILLDDERILSSHSDSFLRLWSSSDGECFMNWFSLIFDSSSYKHGWWMLKWKFVCPPFCHFFSDKFTNAKRIFILVLVISMYLLKKKNYAKDQVILYYYMTFCCWLFTSQSFLLKPLCPIIANLDETVSLETNFKSLYFCQFLTINKIWHILTQKCLKFLSSEASI